MNKKKSKCLWSFSVSWLFVLMNYTKFILIDSATMNAIGYIKYANQNKWAFLLNGNSVLILNYQDQYIISLAVVLLLQSCVFLFRWWICYRIAVSCCKAEVLHYYFCQRFVE
jgi:hypothetical protein